MDRKRALVLILLCAFAAFGGYQTDSLKVTAGSGLARVTIDSTFRYWGKQLPKPATGFLRYQNNSWLMWDSIFNAHVDSARAAHQTDTTLRYDNRYLGLHGKADNALHADTVLHLPDTITSRLGIKAPVFTGYLKGFSDSTAKIPDTITSRLGIKAPVFSGHLVGSADTVTSLLEWARIHGAPAIGTPYDSAGKVPDSISPRTVHLTGSPTDASASDSICVLRNGEITHRTKANIKADIGAGSPYDSAGISHHADSTSKIPNIVSPDSIHVRSLRISGLRLWDSIGIGATPLCKFHVKGGILADPDSKLSGFGAGVKTPITAFGASNAGGYIIYAADSSGVGGVRFALYNNGLLDIHTDSVYTQSIKSTNGFFGNLYGISDSSFDAKLFAGHTWPPDTSLGSPYSDSAGKVPNNYTTTSGRWVIDSLKGTKLGTSNLTLSGGHLKLCLTSDSLLFGNASPNGQKYIHENANEEELDIVSDKGGIRLCTPNGGYLVFPDLFVPASPCNYVVGMDNSSLVYKCAYLRDTLYAHVDSQYFTKGIKVGNTFTAGGLVTANTGIVYAKATTGELGATNILAGTVPMGSATVGLAASVISQSTSDVLFTQNSVVPFRSENTGAVANTLYLKTGLVGIGTTAPASLLHVKGTPAVITLERYNNGAYGPSIVLKQNRAGAASQNNDEVGYLSWTFLNSTPAEKTSAQILSVVTNVTAGAETGDLLVRVYNAGVVNTAMTIKGSGLVGIGRTPTRKLDAPGALIDSASIGILTFPTEQTAAAAGNVTPTSSRIKITGGAGTYTLLAGSMPVGTMIYIYENNGNVGCIVQGYYHAITLNTFTGVWAIKDGSSNWCLAMPAL